MSRTNAFTQRFVLSDRTKMYIYAQEPEFGFNGLGEVVFRRTYSRNNESWNDVVVRVIEGVMSIRKEHFFRNNLRWDDDEWQNYAKKMAISLFKMEWMPPGRGLWMMGTDFAYERGSMALNNCAATDTTDDIVLSAEWTMDALMNGVGVGFNTNWRGEANKPDKNDFEVFYVPDDRAGWVKSLQILLSSYIDSPRYGKNKFPTFDYSLLRPAGAPISGFGGVASGYEPLKKMHDRVEKYLDSFCDGYITDNNGNKKEYGHTRLVADVFNSIGACVVAGNVRRSAQICLGDVEDETFLDLKNYEKNPERGEIAWMSNNSVVLKADCDYKEFGYIPDMASRIRDNGEPGMINLLNIQKYGRYGKESPDAATLVNPCFRGNTLIAVADGRGCVPIKTLAEEGKDVPVYSINPETQEMSIQWGRNPRVTGTDQKLIRIHFGGPHKGQYIDVTPNHKCITTDGRTVEAKNLKKGDSMPMFKKAPNGTDDYIMITKPNKIRSTEHRMIKKFYETNRFYNENYKEGIYNGCCKTNGIVVHHKDEDKQNNHPNNLEITTAGEHTSHHNDMVGEKNPMFGRLHSEETKDLIRQKVYERCMDPSYRQKLSDSQTPEMRERASKMMKNQKRIWDIEACDQMESEAVRTNLKFIRHSPTKLSVVRICENLPCSKEFEVRWAAREQSYCSVSCANTKKESIARRIEGQKAIFVEKARENFHNQVMIYKDLAEKADGTVMKKEWEQACKKQKITHRFQRGSTNPWIAAGWRDFKKMADDYNHRVDRIEYLDGSHTVYNITVDENHTLAVVTKASEDFKSLTGVYIANCGEIPLENFELCNLAETFPPRCAGPKQYFDALEYATFYASTVSLLPTHRPETNAVIARNRRIGVSISGVAQWASGEVPDGWGDMNYTKMTKFLRAGYKTVKAKNEQLARDAGVPASIRVTTIKPSGSISLLAGVTPGMHYPVSRYAIRRMRIGKSSPLVPILQAANIPNEPDTYSDNTLVFEFTIDHGDVRPCEEVSPWEQFKLLEMLQRCYSDNCVSATIYFDKEKDGKDVEKLLAMFIPTLKSVSMLPHSGHGYAQAPYEPITKEEYDKRSGAYSMPKFEGVKGIVPEGSKYCSGDNCEL